MVRLFIDEELMQYKLIQSAEIQLRDSAGYVKDIYDPAISIRQPLSEYRTMLDLIHRDPTLATAYDIIVDFATHRGFDFTGGTKPKRDALRIAFENINFKQVIPNIIYQLLYYGDAFLEMKKNDSKEGIELHPLETTEMRIIYDKHGKVSGYVQRPFNITGMTEEQVVKLEGSPDAPNQGIFWKEEDIIHFRMKWIGSQVYSYNPNEPLGTVASTKIYAGNYLMNIFMNMPPRYVAHLSGINKADYESAKKEFQSAKTNYKKTIAFSRSNDPNSTLTIQKIDAPYDETTVNILQYLSHEILKVTRVPRSWIEESSSDNRGITESEQRPFDVRIKAIHRNVLEPKINKKLLPALGPQYANEEEADSTKSYLKFNEISIKGETEILMNCATLQGMGLKPDALVRYLDFNGILGLDEDDFNDPMMMQSQPGEIPAGKANKDVYPSRKRMNANVSDMNSNLNSAGVSAESGKKMPKIS